MVGKAEVGEMVQTPLVALQLGSLAGMSKFMVSTSARLPLVLAWVMACRSEPAPESSVLMTMKVAGTAS